MTDRAPIYGLLYVLQAGLNNQPVDKKIYDATRQTVESSNIKGSLRKVLVGNYPTGDERHAFRHVLENARDFVNLTQDSSTITDNVRDAAVATVSILLAADQAHDAFDRHAAKLVAQANPELFSHDPLGPAAIALYTMATVLQGRKRILQTMRLGIMGLERDLKGLPNGTEAALSETHRLLKQTEEINNASGQGTADRFFKKHSTDEEHNT